MGCLFSEYTQTYQTVQGTIQRPVSKTVNQQNKARRRKKKCLPKVHVTFFEQQLRKTKKPWTQVKPKSNPILIFPVERTQQVTAQKHPQTNTKQTKAKAASAQRLIQCTLNWKIIVALLTVAALALLIVIGTLLILRQYSVTGSSMEPTLAEGDKIYYTSFQNVSYGDIVIFDTGDSYGLVVKRVIGLPGDTIQISADGAVVRNLVLLEEPYMQADAFQNSGVESVTVQDGMVFLIGDNRAESIDSRDVRVGQIPISSICGKVQIVVRNVD